MRRRRFGWQFWQSLIPLCALHVALFTVIYVLPGCVAFDPGGQVGRGLGQSKTYEWSENGRFRVDGNGPQTERFTMAEGDIVMSFDDDGNEVVDWSKSKIKYYLRADPKADDAANAMNAALLASTAQIDRMSQSFDNLLSTLLPMLANRSGGSSNNDKSDDSVVMDRLERLLGVLEKRTTVESD